MQQNLILVVFPDGVGIRNYLYSSALNRTGYELALFHGFSPKTIQYLSTVKKFQNNYVIPDYRESVREKFLRELICLARLRYNAKITGNRTILHNWKRGHIKIKNVLFYKSVELAAVLLNRYSDILKFEQKYQRAVRKNPFYMKVLQLLEQISPASVFCTHQRGLKMATIFAAASDLGIATTTVIYSWDNLPKARMALRADIYHVWSDYMKDEMLKYYPEIKREQIAITGTPQFEFYHNPDNIIPADQFYARYKLDGRKIICYSGDDTKTAPDDPQYLADVANSIVQAGLDQQYQILFRRCPVDFSGRYDDVVKQFPMLIKEAPPLWQVKTDGHWTEAFPLIDDVQLLVSTAYYCDLVINLGSTMAMDFAMFNKPCLYINYDQQQRTDENWSVAMIYQFEHFKSMNGLDAVGWINSEAEIAPLIVDATTLRQKVGPDRIKWLNKIVGEQPVAQINFN